MVKRDLAIILVTLAVLALAPRFATFYIISLLIAVLMYVALAESWSIFSGYTKYLSFATAAFFGTGAYTMVSLEGRVPYHVAVLAGGGVSLLLAIITGFVVLRLRGPYFAILTFGLAELVQHLFLWWEINVTRTVGRLVKRPPERLTIYFTLAAVAGAAVLLNYFLRRSRLGLALISIGEDEDKAQTVGVNATVLKVAAYAVSAFFAGLVGAIIAPRWSYIDPHIVFNPLISFQVIIMALIGGPREVHGPVIGAVILAVASEILLTRFPYYYLIALGILLITIVLFLPYGIAGLGGRLVRFTSRTAMVPQSPRY